VTRIFTYVELDGHTCAVGEAYLNFRRGMLSGSFSYGHDYLGLRGAYAIDPVLRLNSGRWALPHGLPGAFSDAAPDRWGRNLIAKRLRAQATADGGPVSQPDDRDYLLGVSDETRQGALRFKTDSDGEFQHPAPDVPKLIALPKLMRAADQVARDAPDSMAAIKMLLDAGTGSLGGARPKASVRDGDRLLIAKFPHHSDGWDVIAWEKTALDLAEAAGIAVPGRRLVDVDGRSVLLLDRFDRAAGNRIGYMSAMTLIERRDGEFGDYTEIAETIPEHSANTSSDLRELWRRVVFSVAVHNTDDHLRNHGFLRHKAGWRLAPAFDINPNPDLGARRVTGVGGSADPEGNMQALLTYAESFDLTVDRASGILREVAKAVANWASAARRNGISETEINRFAPVLDRTVAVVANAA
jgi:serine/threonine-protein kinase HipA